jgi:hypothetical protein
LGPGPNWAPQPITYSGGFPTYSTQNTYSVYTQYIQLTDYIQYIQFIAYNRMPGGLARGCEPRGVSEEMKKGKNVKKTSRAVSKGVRLDFKLAGAKEGAYTLVKNLKNAALNKAIDKLIEEADAMRAMTLKQCQQG